MLRHKIQRRLPVLNGILVGKASLCDFARPHRVTDAAFRRREAPR